MPRFWGPYGRGAVALARRFRGTGANALWFHGFSDQAFEACVSAGLAPCVEVRTFRADFDKRPDLVPTGADGKPIRYGRLVQGVCLSRGDFLEEIEETLRSGLKAYEPAGVWLDYLTYAGWFETPEPDLQESCFCDDCIAEFCGAAGLDAATPAEILGRHQREWTDHKCRRVAGLASRYASLVRAARPGCVVGAYMCPWTPQEHDGALRRIFAQDYGLLAEAVDVFTPLIYAAKCGRAASWSAEFLDGCRSFVPAGSKVQLILDALDFPASMQAAADAARQSWGLQMFGGATLLDDEAKTEAWTRLLASMQAAA